MSHSLTNSTKDRFLHRESEFSTRGSRTGANLLGWEEDEDMEPEESRDALVKKHKNLQARIKVLPKKSQERRELGLAMKRIQDEIRAIRPKRKHRGIENFMLDVIREDVTKAQWESWLRRAQKLQQKEQSSEQET